MTIQPGSLDYLYYNGILDHIPYEAYEYTPVTKSGMTQYNTNMMPAMNLKQAALTSDQYIKEASLGDMSSLYNVNNTYTKSKGKNTDKSGTENEEKNFRTSITEEAEATKHSVLHNSSTWKGLAALALLIATPILIFKTRKKTKI